MSIILFFRGYTNLTRPSTAHDTGFSETTFAAASSYLAPTHDYAMVGNVRSHTKFSIAQDGKVWLANFSIFSPTSADQAPNVTGGMEPGVLLFNPQDHLTHQPVHHTSYLERTPFQKWRQQSRFDGCKTRLESSIKQFNII